SRYSHGFKRLAQWKFAFAQVASLGLAVFGDAPQGLMPAYDFNPGGTNQALRLHARQGFVHGLAGTHTQYQSQNIRGTINLGLEPIEDFGLLLSVNLFTTLRITDEGFGCASGIAGTFGVRFQ